MAKRKIIKIDEEKCSGCGLCLPNCPEGAIQVIDGKARLISDSFCDGLGACIGHCPKGAIIIEERQAASYDELKAMRNTVKQAPKFLKEEKTALRQWPVQLMLVPVQAPFLEGADLLIAADCVAFAYADFHKGLLKDKVLLVGCPKLDDVSIYQEKISAILAANNIKSVTCAHMEVPCCFGFVGLIKEAIENSGKDIPYEDITISVKGAICKQ
ncbi:MAG: 4Fe-4S binding protein [Candidatus Omnitrophica bacterium]|nr:4Fe-4S binding protein [Candidatus Omnitrophota bacterium]